MNTIKTWSEALKARHGDAITSTLDVHRAMQAEIDELRTENAALLAANLDCIAHFDALEADYKK